MPQEIDRLEVAVRANAQTANSQLDLLIGKLSAVNSALRTVNTGGLQGLANSIRTFASASQSLKNVGTADFTRLAKNIEKLSTINTASLNRTASALNIMGSSLTRLSSTSANIAQIAAVAQALGKFGGVSVTRAIANMPLLADAVVKMMESLRTAPQVSQNLIDMTNALSRLTANGGKVATSVNSMNRYIRGTSRVSHTAGKSLNLFRGHTVRAEKSSRNLASSIGMLYAKFWMLLRIVRIFGKVVGSSMNFIETAHYFNVVMDKIGTENMNRFKQYGYDSAEAYKKSFNDRMQVLTGKMTGYTFDSTGNATDTNFKSLNLDVNQMTNYQASVLAVTNSLGLCGETSLNTAKAFSMLSADMSSLRNVDLKTVMTNLTSGLIGQSRALYKYGIDITNNTLQQVAYANGIEKSVSAMTQAEKMQLRLLAILDQSRLAWGDMANTLNTPANQLRLLKQEFANLGRVIGSVFMPAVAGVLPYINGLVKALQRLFTWLGNTMGIDMKKYSSAQKPADDTWLDLIEDTEDFGTSLDNANDKAKALKNTLLGFDEINKLNGVDIIDIGTGNGNPNGLINLDREIADLVGEYKSVWDKAFEEMENRAQNIADRICKAFKSKDFYGIGSFISTSISDALGGIRWESVYEKAAGFGNGLAEFLNGLFKPELFKNLGGTIAGAINTAITAKKEFAKKLDFSAIGSALSEGIVKFFADLNWDNIKESASAWATGIANFINGLFTPELFSGIGGAIASAFNTAVSTVKDFASTLNFEKIGSSIKEGVSTFLKNIEWDEVKDAAKECAKGLGKFINGIISSELFGDIGTTLAEALNTAVDALYELGLTIDFENAGKSIGEGTNSFFKTFDFKKLAQTLNLWVDGLEELIGQALKKLSWSDILSATGDFFSNLEIDTIGVIIGVLTIKNIGMVALGTGISSFFAGKIGALLSPVTLSSLVATTAGLVANYGGGNGLDLFAYNVFTDIEKAFEKLFPDVSKFLGEFILGAVSVGVVSAGNPFAMIFGGLVTSVGKEEWLGEDGVLSYKTAFSWFKEAEKSFETAFDGNRQDLIDIGSWIFEGIMAGFVGALYLFAEPIDRFFIKLWEALCNVLDSHSPAKKMYPIGENILSGIMEGFKEAFSFITDPVKNFFTEIWDKLCSTFGIHSPATETESIGENILKGILVGFEDAFTFITDPIKNFFTAICDKLCSVFGIHSPSDETKPIGENILLGIVTGFEDAFGSFSEAIGRFFSDTVSNLFSFSAWSESIGSIKDALMGKWDLALTGWNDKKSLSDIEVKTPDILSSLKNAWNAVTNWWNSSSRSLSADITSTTHISASGIVHGGGGRGFATGGFPDAGELFFARENGLPEMVGQFGNQTAVANNMQIIEGIKSGVTEAMMNVAMATSDSGKQKQRVEIPIYIGKREVGRASYESMQDMVRSGEIKPIFQ